MTHIADTDEINKVVGILISALKEIKRNEDIGLCVAIEKAISIIGVTSIDQLIETLKNADRLISPYTIGALKTIGNPAVEPLIRALKKETGPGKSFIATALNSITGKKFLIGNTNAEKWEKWYGTK